MTGDSAIVDWLNYLQGTPILPCLVAFVGFVVTFSLVWAASAIFRLFFLKQKGASASTPALVAAIVCGPVGLLTIVLVAMFVVYGSAAFSLFQKNEGETWLSIFGGVTVLALAGQW